jgi:sulfur carrier protein ThiS
VQVTVTRRGQLKAADLPYDEVVTLPEGARTGDLLRACGVDPRSCVVVLNGSAATRDTMLRHGDRAQLVPHQAGG